jgi:hypothetical protein
MAMADATRCGAAVLLLLVTSSHCLHGTLAAKQMVTLGGKVSRTPARTHVILVSEHQTDILDATLRCNAKIPGKIIVITSHRDLQTQEVAKRHGVSVHLTDALHFQGAPFNKGRAIRELQTKLHNTPGMDGDRIILTDGDICFPAQLWEKLPTPGPGQMLVADRRCDYGTPANVQQGRPSIIRHNRGLPMGYFQLYRLSSSAPLYPDHFTEASGSDWDYGQRFKVSSLDIGLVHFGQDSHWGGESVGVTEFAKVTPPHPLECPKHVEGVEDSSNAFYAKLMRAFYAKLKRRPGLS